MFSKTPHTAVCRLSPCALGMALGILLAILSLIAALVGAENVLSGAMGRLQPHPDKLGITMGILALPLMGFLIGFLYGVVIGWVYNCCLKKCCKKGQHFPPTSPTDLSK